MVVHTKKIILPILILAGILLISTVAFISAHGGNTERIHACVKNNNSSGPNIRIVGADESCKSNETALDWNIQGPPGPGSDDSVTVGGGVTGRWEGTISAPGPCAPGQWSLVMILIETSSGSITGSLRAIPPESSTAGITGVLGVVNQPQLTFEGGSFTFSGAQSDVNNMSGTATSDCVSSGGTFSVQRVPLLP